MPEFNGTSDLVHMFMSELTSRIVAQSGIPTDRFHLGKLILRSLQDAPDFLMQIDGATDEYETNSAGLKRIVQCAISLKNFGLETGDVMVLMAPNHIDLAIPLYAALCIGVAVAAIDVSLGVEELEDMFKVNQANIIFCQSETTPVIKHALENIKLNAEIVTFNGGNKYCTFSDFLKKYGDDSDVMDFRPTDFDAENTVAFLTSTSGTTGLPKAVALTHKNLAIATPYLWLPFSKFPTPTQTVLIGAPLQWLSAGFQYLFSPILRFTRLQSSLPLTQEHFCHLLNTYKPTYTGISPTLMTTLMKPGSREQLDITSFEVILLGGSVVSQEIVDTIKKASPETRVFSVYGISEISGLGLYGSSNASGSSGKPLGSLEYRLVHIDTKEDIIEPNVSGELLLRGPVICKGYYKNPEVTAEAFVEDGWMRTGDIFYRDDHWNFYFVERLKLLLKYKSHQISPVEVEGVIRQHPGVLDVAVAGIPDLECGDLPVACVVPRPGHTLTAQEIKNLVKDRLADSKRLRGGVIFMNELPTTVTTKVHRRKLKEMVLTMARE